MQSVSMRDHLRPTDGDYPGGIYRVVASSPSRTSGAVLWTGSRADGSGENGSRLGPTTDDETASRTHRSR